MSRPKPLMLSGLRLRAGVPALLAAALATPSLPFLPTFPFTPQGRALAAPALVHQKVSHGPDARQASIAVESGGRVWISYLNLRGAGVLEVLRRETNGAWSMDSVQAVNPGAGAPSLVLSASGSPIIAYSTCCNYEIGLATRSGGVWSIELPVANTTHLFGKFPSLALGGTGEPRLLFGDGFAIVLATKSGTTWSVETVEPGNGADLPFTPRLRLGGDGSRQALYLLTHPTLARPLRFASGAPWAFDVLPTVGPQGSFDLALDALSKPHIAYVGAGSAGVWYGKKDPGWTYERVDSAGRGGVSLAFDPGGVPHVVYRRDGALWLGRREGGGWTREPLTIPGFMEFHHEPDLAFDAAGKMHLVYSEEQSSGEWHLIYAGEGGTVAAEAPGPAAGARPLALAPPWPNPSRGALTLRLSLAREDDVVLEIVDAAGRRVAERPAGRLAPGEHVVPWDVSGLSAGLYFARARARSGEHAARAFVVAR